MDKAI